MPETDLGMGIQQSTRENVCFLIELPYNSMLSRNHQIVIGIHKTILHMKKFFYPKTLLNCNYVPYVMPKA